MAIRCQEFPFARENSSGTAYVYIMHSYSKLAIPDPSISTCACLCMHTYSDTYALAYLIKKRHYGEILNDTERLKY